MNELARCRVTYKVKERASARWTEGSELGLKDYLTLAHLLLRVKLLLFILSSLIAEEIADLMPDIPTLVQQQQILSSYEAIVEQGLWTYCPRTIRLEQKCHDKAKPLIPQPKCNVRGIHSHLVTG